MLIDLQLALRRFVKQPMTALAMSFTLALAVASNTALFSIFDGLLLRPLPYPDAQRLVHVELGPNARLGLSQAERKQIEALMLTSAVLENRAEARIAPLLEDGAAAVKEWQLRPAYVTPNLFPMLGVRPVVGRLLGAEDLQLTGETPVLISYDLWQSRFSGDPGLIGKSIQVPGTFRRRAFRLVGVMPRGFAFPDGANLWVPSDNSPNMFNLARLPPGVTENHVRAALPRVSVTSLREHIQPEGAFAVAVLLCATTLLLLVAWVQVGSLLFMRSSGRMHEIDLRLTLGASRWQMVRHLSSDGIVLAVASTAIGAMAVPALTSGLILLLPEEMTRGQSLSPDVRTMLFSSLLAAIGATLFSLLPVGLLRRTALLGMVHGRTGEQSPPRAERRRFTLLGVQLALTTALLYLASLTTQSLLRVTAVDLGFDSSRLVGIQVPLMVISGSNSATHSAQIARQNQQMREVLSSLQQIPGVAIAASGPIPFYNPLYSTSILRPIARQGQSQNDYPMARVYEITPDYPVVLGLKLVDGRIPSGNEVASGAYVLVNETLARQFRQLGSIVGQELTIPGGQRSPWHVAGVVRDFVQHRPDLAAEGQLFRLVGDVSGAVVARLAEGGETAALVAIRKTVDGIWSDRASREIVDISQLAHRATTDYRARAILLGIVGTLCLPLAVAGVAGAATDSVQRRVREIGIRLALGASVSDIALTIVRPTLLSAFGGLFGGLALGWLMGRLISGYLFGVEAASLVGVVASAAALFLVGVVGTVWPLLRALRIQPAEALRRF